NLNDFDFRISTTSLAACVAPELDPSIWPGPYIDGRASWWKRSIYGRRPRVGLCWKAGEKLFPRAHRTLHPKQVARIVATLPSVEWISLVVDEPSPTGVRPNTIRTCADTARLISSCDLIVSVDTGVAHLAGALGKPVHVVLPGASPWPYMLGDAYRLAYPSMRAYRNKGPVIGSSLDDLIGELRYAL